MKRTSKARCAAAATPATRPQGLFTRQQGASLVVSLLMLIATLLLGISAAQIALQGEKSSRNDRDRQIAFQAAEAGLMDAEMDIEKSGDANSRSNIFAPDSQEGFVNGCGTGIYLGLCSRSERGALPVWKTVGLEKADAKTVPYGRFTGQVYETGKGSLPSRRPRYIIELMAYNKEGEGASLGDLTYFYRVTAIGFGTRDTTQVLLQTFYRKDGM
jgi:type IV pilus assembly protein PilX